jgi:hypothetical protein
MKIVSTRTTHHFPDKLVQQIIRDEIPEHQSLFGWLDYWHNWGRDPLCATMHAEYVNRYPWHYETDDGRRLKPVVGDDNIEHLVYADTGERWR